MGFMGLILAKNIEINSAHHNNDFVKCPGRLIFIGTNTVGHILRSIAVATQVAVPLRVL